jgi:hypothetical protein
MIIQHFLKLIFVCCHKNAWLPHCLSMYFFISPNSNRTICLRHDSRFSFFICIQYLSSCFLSVYIEMGLSVLLLNFCFCLPGVRGYTRSSVYSVRCLHVVCLSGYDCLSFFCTHWASLDMSVCLSIFDCIFDVGMSC